MSHKCDPTDSWFDREVCPCGGMHYRCRECGAMLDEFEGGGCPIMTAIADFLWRI